MEFALVAPLLLLLLFGIISYGYMLSFRQALSQAVAEAARTAAVTPAAASPSPEERAVSRINDALSSYGVTCTATQVLMHGTDPAGSCTVDDPAACTGEDSDATCVKVTLSYTYRDDELVPSFPGIGAVLPEQLTYSTEVQVS